jgi:tetratricopeptide (TPR) repeat protein
MSVFFSTLLNQANAARDVQDFPLAVDLYSEALRFDKSALNLLVQSGHCLKECGSYDDAKKDYEVFRNAHPDDPDIYLQLGHLAKLRDELANCIEAYTAACNLSKVSPTLYRFASIELDAVLSVSDLAALRRASRALADLDFEYAYKEFMRALKPDWPGRFAVLAGHACKETGRYAEAKVWYELQVRYATNATHFEPALWVDAIEQFGVLLSIDQQHVQLMELYLKAAAFAESTTRVPRVDNQVAKRYREQAQASLKCLTTAVALPPM